MTGWWVWDAIYDIFLQHAKKMMWKLSLHWGSPFCLTNCDQVKMARILQITFSNAFSPIKMPQFLSNFEQNMFLRTLSQFVKLRIIASVLMCIAYWRTIVCFWILILSNVYRPVWWPSRLCERYTGVAHFIIPVRSIHSMQCCHNCRLACAISGCDKV